MSTALYFLRHKIKEDVTNELTSIIIKLSFIGLHYRLENTSELKHFFFLSTFLFSIFNKGLYILTSQQSPLPFSLIPPFFSPFSFYEVLHKIFRSPKNQIRQKFPPHLRGGRVEIARIHTVVFNCRLCRYS